MAPRELLRAMFDAAVASALPARRLAALLPPRPAGRVVIIGVGKASAAMAQAVEAAWGDGLQGLVVTRYGHAAPLKNIEIVEAGHPMPDANGASAAARMLAMVQGLREDDLVLALVSGGGSALLTLPAPGLTLADKQAVNKALLACGASIDEINCVRKHLSAVKGGRLAAAAFPARVLTLLISDVPGDDPAVIASGPTVADPSTFAQARAVLAKYAIDAPPAVVAHLARAKSETPKPGDPRLARCETRMIATPLMALEAAAGVARAAGVTPVILADDIEGEARDVGKVMAAMARHTARRGGAFGAPCVLLSGGETTVTVRGKGRGGRNVEFLLSLALALKGEPSVYALAGDTDGVDGAEEVAGAVITPDTLSRAAALGLHAAEALDNNDAHTFFAALGDQVITGPTLTNVNDFRAVLVM